MRKSFSSIQGARSALENLYVRRNQEYLSALTFPEPPLRGTDGITPVQSGAALAALARDCENCLMEHASRLSKGRAFVYRVETDEVATLTLVRRGSHWAIRDLLGVRNRQVPQLYGFVRAWLDREDPFSQNEREAAWDRHWETRPENETTDG